MHIQNYINLSSLLKFHYFRYNIIIIARAGKYSSGPGLSTECPGAVRTSGDVGGDGRVSAVRGKNGEGPRSATSANCCERDTDTLVSTR